jgi:hypothetical protein
MGCMRDCLKNNVKMPDNPFLAEKAMDTMKCIYKVLAAFALWGGECFLFAISSAPDAVMSELKRLKIEVAGPPVKQFETQLPSTLSDANWGLKKIICEQGGLIALASKNRQRLGDMVADTFVLYEIDVRSLRNGPDATSQS